MDTELRSEIFEIVRHHLGEVSRYTLSETGQNHELQSLVLSLERLAEICSATPQISNSSVYEEAIQCLSTVEAFLTFTHQQKDAVFYETYIGGICAQADQWCRTMLKQTVSSIDRVWQLIYPVSPDCLSEVQPSMYEAKWWRPVPLMDIEILKRTEGIIIYEEASEPFDLPKGLAIRFSVLAPGSEDQGAGG